MRRLLGLCLAWFSAWAWGQGNVLLVTDLPDDLLSYRPDLRLVSANALNQLDDYQVANAKTQARPSAQGALPALADAAAKADLPYLATVVLSTKRRNATIDINLYQSATAEPILSRSLDFRFKEVPSLLAQLEYELPLMLKRAFRELGTVVQVKSDQIYFDLGRNAGIQPGQVFRVYRRGAEISGAGGASFGYLDEQSGVIVVREVSAIYAIADIRLGRLSIRPDDWVERIDDGVAADARVLSKLDNEVAINLGRQAGVAPGSYFAVFKDIKEIDDDEAFREMIGRIRITEVTDTTARGVIARSDHYSLAKALITENDRVEEVSYLHRNQVLLGQTSFGILGETASVWNVGINAESGFDPDLSFRLRGAYGDNWFVAAGANQALNHSESFRAGIDFLYGADGVGTYLFADANIPTPVSHFLLLAIEAGYLLGGNEAIEGVSVGLSAKFGIDRLF